MKVFSQLLRLGALASAVAVPVCQAFAIRPLASSLIARVPLMKRAIYDVPEIEISGLSMNSSSSPSFDFVAGTASVGGDLSVYVNFTTGDDAVTYDSIQVQGYYVYGGGNTSDLKNSTQIACGSLTGPIDINSSQPLLVPITLQVSNLSLTHPIVIDVASICLGSQGGELQTVWGGWLGASVANETYRCPLPETNLTIACPSPVLQSPGGENNTCSFIPLAPLPPSDSSSSTSTSAAATSSESTSSTESSTSTLPLAGSTSDATPTMTDTSSTTEIATPTTTTDIATPTETSSSSDSTVTPTEATTVSPGVTIATPTPTTVDGTTSQVVPVIVTVTETATAAPARRRHF